VARLGLTAQWLPRSTQQGDTPLHCAAASGHANVCTLLLDRGASLQPVDIAVRLLALLRLLRLTRGPTLPGRFSMRDSVEVSFSLTHFH